MRKATTCATWRRESGSPSHHHPHSNHGHHCHHHRHQCYTTTTSSSSSFPIFVPLHPHLPRSRAGQAQGAGEKGRKISGAGPVGDEDGKRGQGGDRPLVRVGPPLLDPLPSARRSRWGGVQPLSKDYEVAPSVTWHYRCLPNSDLDGQAGAARAAQPYPVPMPPPDACPSR